MDIKEIKKTIDEMVKVSGRVRGEALLNKLAYIKETRGGEGLALIENGFNEIGYPLKMPEIGSLSWYPDAYNVLILLVAQNEFGWVDKEIFEMGKNSPQISIIVKLLIRYFVSAEKTFASAPAYWRKHHSVGYIEVVEFDKKGKKLSFKLKDYKCPSTMCVYLCGYFWGFAALVLNQVVIASKEEQCPNRGGDYHEFVVSWK